MKNLIRRGPARKSQPLVKSPEQRQFELEIDAFLTELEKKHDKKLEPPQRQKIIAEAWRSKTQMAPFRQEEIVPKANIVGKSAHIYMVDELEKPNPCNP